MRYWIFKLNPERGPPEERRPDDPPAYSWERFVQDRRVEWDWVMDGLSRRQLKEVLVGDQAVICHTKGKWKVKGFADVVGGWQTDGARSWVTLAAGKPAKSKVDAAVIERYRRQVSNWTRLSVIPIGQAGWDEIRRQAGL